MKIYIIYQIQPCQFLILVLYCSVCAGSVRCKTVTSMLAFARRPDSQGGLLWLLVKLLLLEILLLKLDENYSKYICKFLILLPFSFLLITWVNLCRIQVFKRLKYSTGREKFKTDLIYLLLTRLKG